MSTHLPVTIPGDSPELRRTLEQIHWGLAHDPAMAAQIAADLFCTVNRTHPGGREQAVLRDARTITLETVRGKPFITYQWGDDGPLVVMMHGWEMQAGRWSAFVRPLTDAGYRVAAIDAVAHGQSPGDRAAMVDFMESIKAAVDHFGTPHALIGHSLGGAAVYYGMATLGIPTTRAVLMSTFDRVEYIVEVWADAMRLPRDILPLIYTHFEQTYGVWSPDYVADNAVPQIAHIPALIVHDRDDEVIPYALGERVARLWTASRLMSTERLRHFMPLRSPEVVNAVVRFVGQGQ